ncbi:MAG: RNA polymerase sigma-70 factor [Candidatus Neomarinimicrobiota bacterium]
MVGQGSPEHHPGQSQEESDWVRQTRGGDPEAFEQLFYRYAPPLINFARRFVHDAQVAEGLVQEVFLRVWKRRTRLDPDRNIKSYLYTATRNRALKELRRAGITTDGARHLTLSVSQPKTPEDEWDEQQMLLQVNRAVARLPKQCRVIFSMSRFDQLTYAEIAVSLNLSIKTVETQMGRALKTLRRSLAHLISIVP